VNIGIVGAGAIGLVFAATLAQTHDVVVLTRRATLAERIANDGIVLVHDDGVETVRVAATVDAQRFIDREAVIVAVKAYATFEALQPLRDVLPAEALVASVQNGIDFEQTARRALPKARIVAGSTTQGAISLGDGRVRAAGAGPTIFASDTSAMPTSDDLAAAFRSAGLDARVVDDIAPVLWRKLIINAAINPLGALTARPNGGVVADPDLRDLARLAAQEAAAVAAAEGIAIDDAWGAVEAAARTTAANRNSMLQDLDAGRPTEIDAISGAITQRAQAHGLTVPLTATLLRLVRARERA
jgi:2-dehydropantoate 2-reductase